MAFPNGIGTGEFVLCQGCLDENWEPFRESLRIGVEAAREAAAANPRSDVHMVQLELAEGALELFSSKQDGKWDEPRLDAAIERIRTAKATVAALAKEPKAED